MEQWECECGNFTIRETTTNIVSLKFLRVNKNCELEINEEEHFVLGETSYGCERCGKKLPGSNLQELETYLEKWKPKGEMK